MIQAILVVKGVVENFQFGKSFTNFVEAPFFAKLLANFQIFGTLGYQAIPIFFYQLLSNVHNIVAEVAIFGEREIGFAKKLSVAGVNRTGKIGHLLPRIVEIVLSGHFVAQPRVQISNAVANASIPTVAQMQQPCWICTYIFNICPQSIA